MKLSLRKKASYIALLLTFPLILTNPANAASSGTTTITLGVNGLSCLGSLGISAPVTFSLGVMDSSTSTTHLGDTVTVTDSRCGSVGWNSTIQITELTDTSTAQTINTNNAIDYHAGTPWRLGSGTGTILATSAATPATTSAIVSAAFGTVIDGAAWRPTITLVLGGTVYSGNYTALGTTSVY